MLSQEDFLDAIIYLHSILCSIFSALTIFCRQNEALKELINPDAALFKTKYLRKSPAMAEALTNKILTIKGLLKYRTPK
jgi:hypothetical protein